MKPIRVLVTGAGSGVGQGIIKALRVSKLPLTVMSADNEPLNAALFRTEEAVLWPKVEESGSLSVFTSVLKENRVDVLMIGSEFDLIFFAQYKREIEEKTGTLIVVSPLETVMMADDKYLTAEFLRKNNLPYVESYLPSSFEDARAKAAEWGYPLLLKPRRGTSSRHVHVLQGEAQLGGLFSSVPCPLLQKLVDQPSEKIKNEYTCSIFKCRDGALLGPFTARRTLRTGHSWIVEVDTFGELRSLLLTIGDRLTFTGSLNVQLMMGPKGPVPFEFNCRFSGTTAVRAHFGFNEPEMAIRNYFLGEKLSEPVIRKGMAFRYPEEVFLEGVGVSDLKESLPKGEVHPWF